MLKSNNVIAIAKHPQHGTDIVIYDHTWTHALKHEELKDCEGVNYCLEEVVETLNNPNVILEGRKKETELFVRYTNMVDSTTFEGYSVSTKTVDDTTIMTTAYHDVIKTHNKGGVLWKKGDNDEPV